MKKALAHLKTCDPILASIISRVGACKTAYREPTFEMLARAIVFQQLSTKAARTIYGRLEEAAGGKLTPESIQNLSVGEMRRAGLSRQKLGYIRDLAENALKHGVASLPAGGEVSISAHRNNGDLQITVTNTGSLSTAKGATAVGLDNARERLRLIYGEGASLTLKPMQSEQVRATVIIPFRQNQGTA